MTSYVKSFGYLEEAEYFMQLYELRKKADYYDEIVSKEEVEKALDLYEGVLRAIRELEAKYVK